MAGLGEVASNILDETTGKPLSYAGWIVGTLMLATGAALYIWIDDNLPELMASASKAVDAAEAEKSDVERRLAEAESRIVALNSEADAEASAFDRLATLYSLGTALREVTDPVLTTGPGDVAQQRERVGAMLDLMVENKLAYFAIEDDQWTFAVYRPGADGKLGCFESRRPNRIDETREHRTWGPGEGHVGRAFGWKAELIIPDACDPVVSSLLLGGQSRPEDNQRYRSVAAVPILAADDALGVVVATSDFPDRFTPRTDDFLDDIDPVEPLRLLAGALATVFAVTKIYESGLPS